VRVQLRALFGFTVILQVLDESNSIFAPSKLRVKMSLLLTAVSVVEV
jgi:hypothetical protein